MTESVVPRYDKVSLTLDAEVLAQVRDRIQPGGLSAYVTQAVRRQLERDQLGELIDELVESNGPLDESAVDAHRAAWR